MKNGLRDPKRTFSFAISGKKESTTGLGYFLNVLFVSNTEHEDTSNILSTWLLDIDKANVIFWPSLITLYAWKHKIIFAKIMYGCILKRKDKVPRSLFLRVSK